MTDSEWTPENSVTTIDAAIACVTAPNPGPMTDKGTNSYVVGDPTACFVVDPGPDDRRHLDALAIAVGNRRVEAILATHRHADHIGLVPAAADRFDCPVFAARFPGSDRRSGKSDLADRADPLPLDRALQPGERLTLSGFAVEVVSTPGHTADHLCFALCDHKLLFSGDHVMGWSTTVVIPPEGRMADYRASLRLLLDRDERRYLPGHGEPVENPHRLVRGMLRHRAEREATILSIIGSAPATLAEIVAKAYPDLDQRLVGAAGSSVTAHLIELYGRGLIDRDPSIEPQGRFALR